MIHEHPYWVKGVETDETYHKGFDAARLDRLIYARRGKMWRR